jgi:hypothetical protein
MKSMGGSGNYPGGHKGSLYSGSTDKSSSNKTDTNKDRCTPLGFDGKLLCRPDSKCPDGYSKIPSDYVTVCKPTGQGVSSGDSYSCYSSGGYPTGISSSHGSGVYAKCEDCGEKHEIEKKLDNDEGCCTLPSAFSRYLFVKVSDADMNVIATAPNTFFIYKPSWAGRDYPLSWDYNTGKHYEKYNFQWYYRVEEPGYIHGK